jgi:hypothetical protein
MVQADMLDRRWRMNQSRASNVTYMSWCAYCVIVRDVSLGASVIFLSNQEDNFKVFIATFAGSIPDGVTGIFH